jgi:hypothetical protein
VTADEVWFRIDSLHDFGPAVEKCRVLRHTPKGVWLDTWLGRPRFVRHDTRKKYAHPTMEAAIDSFRRRKARQIAILAAQHDHAVDQLRRCDLSGVFVETNFFDAFADAVEP